MIEFFLPAILALGITTSYEDIKYGKIRNKWVIIAIIYAILCHLILITRYSFTTGINYEYIVEIATNIIISIIVGYAMWHHKIWSAGDGKLFIAYATLLPLTAYSLGYYSYFPALTLLMNTFLITISMLLVMLLIKIRKKNLKMITLAIKDSFGLKKIAESIIIFFSLSWILQIILKFFNISDAFIMMALLLMTLPYLQKKLGKKLIYISIGMIPLRIFFDNTTHSVSFAKEFMIMALIWIIAIGFLNKIINLLSNEFFIKKVGTDRLENGMIINDLIEIRDKLTRKEKEERLSAGAEIKRHNGIYYIRLEDNEKNINKEEIELTRKKINELRQAGFNEIRIKQTIRLAPFIFIGVISTLIIKGNILIYLRNLF